jgi:hypothetical protein
MKAFTIETEKGENVVVSMSLISMVDPELYLVHIKDGQLDVRIGSVAARKNELVAVLTSGESKQIALLENEGELPAKERENLLHESAKYLYNAWNVSNTNEEN